MRLIDADLLKEEIKELYIMVTGNPNQITVGNEYKKSFSRMIDEQPTVELNNEMLEFLQGEWVECEVVQKALVMDFKQCFAVFDFCRSAEWWSIVGKTEEERSREGQKITDCFRIKQKKEGK